MTLSEFDRFDALVRKVLTVPADVIKARVEEHREESKRNPNRRGPKPKVKPSASDRASREKD